MEISWKIKNKVGIVIDTEDSGYLMDKSYYMQMSPYNIFPSRMIVAEGSLEDHKRAAIQLAPGYPKDLAFTSINFPTFTILQDEYQANNLQ